jgi:hypothetical protein
MTVVSTIRERKYPRRRIWVAQDPIEVENSVILAGRSNPRIYRLSFGLTGG